MNNRYLEIDSNFRNRNEFKLPSQFEVLISQSGTKNKRTALDPVSEETPSLVFDARFNLSIVGAGAETINISGLDISTTGAGYLTDPKNIVVQSVTDDDEFQKGENFYKGATIILTETATGDIVHRSITRSVFLDRSGGTDTVGIGLDSAIPDYFLVATTTATINNPTDTDLTDSPHIFFPQSNAIDSFYNGYIVENVSLVPTETRTVIAFEVPIQTAILDFPASGWKPWHNYVVRRQVASESGTFEGAPTTTTMIISSGNSIPNFYVGDFIRITDPTITTYNESRRIVGYDSTTRTVRVSPAFSAEPSDTYEILSFTRDNAVPFNYTGSLVSQQEMVCYEIELISLNLPNGIQKTGGRIAFYPYVYVELRNISSSGAGIRNIIYSNNPYTSRMLFKASVSDVSNPTVTAFIRLDGDGMTQTIKFKPNDSFKFGVYLPTGEPFETDAIDTKSPAPANLLVNISAVFRLRRL